MVGKDAGQRKRRAEEDFEAEEAEVPTDDDTPTEEEESGSDGGEYDDDDDGGGLADFAAGAGSAENKSTARDALWADPTHDEMQGLRETELLFKSSLMRLQIEELKGEVSVDYTKLAPLEEWLHTLRAHLIAIPAARMPASRLAGAEPPAIDAFDFEPPSAVHVVGSFLLRTLARPALSVDVAVEIPAASLHHKDFLNNKYFQKRQLFLARIADSLEKAGLGSVTPAPALRPGRATAPAQPSTHLNVAPLRRGRYPSPASAATRASPWWWCSPRARRSAASPPSSPCTFCRASRRTSSRPRGSAQPATTCASLA
jgi:hypothetical protein